MAEIWVLLFSSHHDRVWIRATRIPIYQFLFADSSIAIPYYFTPHGPKVFRISNTQPPTTTQQNSQPCSVTVLQTLFPPETHTSRYEKKKPPHYNRWFGGACVFSLDTVVVGAATGDCSSAYQHFAYFC
jgi:hypothetical protein